MKKILLQLTCLFTCFFTGCALFNPTPKLTKQYESLHFEYTNARHEDWSRKYLSDEWQYNSGFYSGDKQGDYFHLYKNGNLVFNYEPEEDILIDNVVLKNNKVYFIMSTFLYENGKHIIKTSINYLDEEFKHHKIYETENYNLSNLNVNSSVYFIESLRGEIYDDNVIEIDFEGKLINKFKPATDNGTIRKLSLTNDGNLIISIKTDFNDYFLYSKTGKFIKKLASLPKDLLINSFEYENNKLYVLGYTTTYKDLNLINICIKEYKNDNLNTIFNIDMPDDYGYYNWLFQEYNNDIYLSFSVSKHNKSKSIYSRHLILKCNKLDNSIKVIYKNIPLSHNVYYNNGHIYLGNYRNDCYVNNEGSGDFIDIDLSQFN